MARWSALQHGRPTAWLVFFSLLQVARATPGPCEVETGQSSIIVDIEESRGDQVNQSTVPVDLPIVGDPDVDVILSTVFPKGPTLFQLDGKRLQLLQPLDRDADNLSHMVFQLVCQVKATKKRRTIPVIVRVSDINDNAPVFQGTPYEANVSELIPIGTTIFSGIKATDLDAGVNGLAEYFIIPGDNQTLEAQNAVDGYGSFAIPLPHQGQVTVNRSLDYERTQKYLVTILASDRARDTKRRLSSTTTMTVNVLDDDDQDPSFIYKGCTLHEGACFNPEYTSFVDSSVLAGLLTIKPEKIQAVDMDTLDARIKYSIETGEPDSWDKYFAIDPNTGAVRQLVPVDTSIAKKFQLVIKAEEVTEARRFTTAKLTITVRPVDASPPVIEASANEGMVEENSPKGTKVVDINGQPIRLTVSDPDLGPGDPVPKYKFELTANFFDIDKDGYLVVNDDKLDRDPPNPGKLRFQVVAREANGVAASDPYSLAVQLLDQNDNAPVIPKTQPITVPASLEPTAVHTVEAIDIDEGENARITYSIYHVSNNGGNKFTIHPNTGVISSTGRLQAGEQYSVTVRATDAKGLSSQGIVELSVAPGPNTRPPQFSSRDYYAPVSEGAAINSTVTTVTAKDPENEQVTYSIASGNDLRQFAIGSNTGIITVIRSLDREVLTRYQLMVRAEDPGRLSSTATVNIKVTDINDNNPKFDEDSYLFHVKEGAANEFVGYVHATDIDDGMNAVVSYSIPTHLPFSIDNGTGMITTNTKLDYETTKDYAFVVTATDGAIDKRLGTASVTVQVTDVPDEAPVFAMAVYSVHVPENAPNYPVVKVEAEDPDTIPEITYTIIMGDTELFSIDRKSGLIRTLKPLDRETSARHQIVVGTEENNTGGQGSNTTVEVFVDDKNDNAPIFTSVVRPVTIEDSSSIGSLVQTVVATDSDATPPNNRVRYKLVGRGKASIYFHVEPDTGAVRVRDDLRKETDSEYTVDVQAYDQGEPMMSSVSTLTVYVSHSATVPPDVGLGFADTLYTEHVAENSPNGTLIRILPLLNKREHSPDTPLKCRLTESSQKGVFYVKLTEERDCAIYLNTSSLDYETLAEYSLEVQLESIQGLINPESSKATIKVHVTDANDNAPMFVFPEQSSIEAAKGKYYAIVTKDMLLGTNVLQVKAKDRDSGDFGKVEYQKNSWTKAAEEYFSLDTDTGVITNTKTFENVPKDVLPFKFSVTARDNPNSAQDYNISRASVVINLLQKENQLVVEVADLNADTMRRRSRSLLTAIEEKTGLYAGLEKLTSRHYLGENGTLESDAKGTDVWLYLLDPATGEILSRESKPVKKAIESGVHKAVAARLQTAVGAVRAPLQAAEHARRPHVAAAPLATALPAALIALAAVVLVAAIAATIYICASWNRYKKHKEQAIQQYGTLSMSMPTPRPASGYESSEDEPAPRYETQINLLQKENQLVVEVADLNADTMRRRSRSLLTAIEEKTGLYAGLEKLTSRHYLGENGTLESDAKGTDVWLYLLDPATGEILSRESKPVKKAIESGVHKAVAARLQTAVGAVRAPLQAAEHARRPHVAAAPLATALPAALIALAAVVLVAAIAATIYICASWNRYKKHKEQAIQQYGTLSMSMPTPRPASGYESSEDEPAPRYETQVLNMAVDDADLQLDFSPNNHAFNIHSVQYMSKENGERSPTLSETATTARASSVNENGGTLNNMHNGQLFEPIANNSTLIRNTQTLNRRAPNAHPLNNAIGTLPRVNNNNVGGGLLATTLGRKINGGNNHKKKATQPIMAYDEIPGLQRASDNDNVTFGKRNFTGYNYDQSPVETTTEL
uniref:Cadherin domain-containing protein n=1 Tax=Heliothis virescens TaxID=7102 RepID=A0A2A4J1V5_HELVI